MSVPLRAVFAIFLGFAILTDNLAQSVRPGTPEGPQCKRTKECGKNEEFLCGGTACQKYCCQIEDLSEKDCPILTFAPVNDCFCKRGYERSTRNNECVPIDCCECKREKCQSYGECPHYRTPLV